MSPDPSTLRATVPTPRGFTATEPDGRPVPARTSAGTSTPVAFRPAALVRGGQEEDDQRGQAARAAGYAAGWAAGSRAAAAAASEQQQRLAAEHARAEAVRDAQVADAVAALQRAARSLEATTAPVVTDCTRTLHEAALALAEAVVRRELVPGPDSARSLLSRALEVPADLGVHTVRVSPADHGHVTALVTAHPELLPDGVTVVADPALAAGDVVSEHPAGYLDGQVATALDRARRALEGTP